MESVDKLKPCPLCGGEAHIEHGLVTWAVVCPCGSHVFYGCEKDKAKTAEAWNTRAATTIGQVAVEVVPTKSTCTMLRLTDYTCQYMHRYACSECGEFNEQPTVMGESEPPNYCPNCGRKVKR